MCKGMGFLRADVPAGHAQFGKLAPCPHPSHQPERAGRVARLSGLGRADLARRLSDIRVNRENREMIEAAQAMIDNPWGWLYLYGGPGSAKTEVLIAIVNELNERGQGPALYTKFSKIINYIREAYAERRGRQLGEMDNMGYVDRFERLKALKVIAIDEMDKARSTEFVEEFRFDFLDDRYRQAVGGETVTIFAGNVTPSSFDSAIWDRIRDGRFKVVHNPAGSARPAMRRAR